MKKLLTFFVALMLISIFSFGGGDKFTWNPQGISTDWQVAANWTKVFINGTAGPSYPGQNNPTDNDDYVIFDNQQVNIVTNVPACFLGRMEITFPIGGGTTDVYLRGALDGNAITFVTPATPFPDVWVVKIDVNCIFDCNTPYQRVKLICQPKVNFWQMASALFYPALDSQCNGFKGFVLQADQNAHAEFVQQTTQGQIVRGWIEYYLDDNNYHFVSLAITSDFTQSPPFDQPNCRKPNCLCIFDGDYVRKLTNGAGWDNWLGALSCTNPILDIETGRGYEFYGAPGTGPTYSAYGDFNTGPITSPITLPVTALGWNFIGNPFPSAINFAEPSGLQTVGPGWTWNQTYVDPVAYWYDASYGNYKSYNWLTGLPNPPGGDRLLARGQGFFVNCVNYVSGVSEIQINNEARLFRPDRLIGKSVMANTLKLTLNDGSNNFMDETTIAFRDDASTSDFDRLLDNYKFFNDIKNVSQLYSKTTNNIDVSVKCLKTESGNVMYPIYMKVENTGTYSITASDISTFSPNSSIVLKDNKTSATIDLKVNPVYTFTATEGDNDARFNLYFSNVLYGINNLNDNTFKVYSYDNSIFIQNNDPKSTIGTVLVYDMIGKQMIEQSLNNDGTTRIYTNLNKGFYIVSIKTDKGSYNQKVYIN